MNCTRDERRIRRRIFSVHLIGPEDHPPTRLTGKGSAGQAAIGMGFRNGPGGNGG
ncbi:MAG TPA: hypothetical protein VGB08_02465 [Allosphingosinicella sp.]|jgi:hypothetical protein